MDNVKDVIEYLSEDDNIRGLETLLLLISIMSLGRFVALRISHHI